MNKEKNAGTITVLAGSPGMLFLNRQKQKSFSLNIFSGNYKELNETLKLIENVENGILFWNPEFNEEKDQIHREANRLFHNYIASAKTLIEHTRNHMKSFYKGMPIWEIYTNKIAEEFSADPLCKFVQDLRNYILHKGTPPSRISFRMTRDNSAESSVEMDVAALLLWGGWSKEAVEYLNGSGNHLKFSTVVTEYGEKITTFHNWLDQELYNIHQEYLT